MKQFLSSHERDFLKTQHRMERDKRVCDRIKAVLLSDDGWGYKEIAHVLLLGDEAIKQHIHEYTEAQKLTTENKGSPGKLNTECAGILDICQRLKLIDATRYGRGRELLLRIVAMLTKMAKNVT